MCCSKRDIIIFAAGAQAFHTLSHIIIYFSHTLPLQFFSYTFTAQMNSVAIVLNGLITVGLIYWAHCLKKNRN